MQEAMSAEMPPVRILIRELAQKADEYRPDCFHISSGRSCVNTKGASETGAARVPRNIPIQTRME